MKTPTNLPTLPPDGYRELVSKLFTLLPPLDLTWPAERQEQWWEWLRALMKSNGLPQCEAVRDSARVVTPETDQQCIRAEAAFRAGAVDVVTADFARELESRARRAEDESQILDWIDRSPINRLRRFIAGEHATIREFVRAEIEAETPPRSDGSAVSPPKADIAPPEG
jgi:hypothetical protein